MVHNISRFVLIIALGAAHTSGSTASEIRPTPKEFRDWVGDGKGYYAYICRATQVSGSLRVRAWPQGRVVGGVARGDEFAIENAVHDKTRSIWYLIEPFARNRTNGWILSDHVTCESVHTS